MTTYNPLENVLKIIIPNAGIKELYRYQKGILSILNKIQIENCEASFKEDLKAVYELLNHIQVEQEPFPKDENLVHQYGHPELLNKSCL